MDFSSILANLKQHNLYRSRKTIDSVQESHLIIDGKARINFCSNDYLSLAHHPQVKAAFKQGIHQYGVGSGASHLVSGHSNAHHELEEALADYTRQQRTLLYSTGYMANLGVFSALKGELDWVLQDKLNHASLIDANQLIGLPVQRYLHNDMASLKRKIAQQTNRGTHNANDLQPSAKNRLQKERATHSHPQRGQGMIVTDTVFSMDGDRANMNALHKIKEGEWDLSKKNGAKVHTSNTLLMQDDAHGFGLFEPNIPKNSIYMATLGKAAGTMGAFVAGDADFIEFLIQKSRPYIYTTALPPALCIATLKSLELIKNGEQKAKLLANIDFFRHFSSAIDLPILPSHSAIQPLMIGDSEKALNLSQTLFNQGFYVSAIRPPTVPKGTERLRITLNANHTPTQIEQLLIGIKNAL